MDDPRLTSALQQLDRSSDDPSSLCWPFVEMFAVSGATVATLGRVLGTETIAASDDVAANLDELQFDLGEGPCWDAVSSARPVLVPYVQQLPSTTWPAFSSAIKDQPIGSVFAFPMVVGPLRLGAVDLYSTTPTELDHTQSRQAGIMAEAVGKQLFRRALAEAGDDDPAATTYSRRAVHQATGMVIAQLRLPGEEARLVIHGHAFAIGRPVMEVAQEILDGRIVFSHGDDGIEAKT